ncbi:MAG: GGDEF domain-containing protein [Eubacterium sp.]|nr:GGDEF domain-containing protein [Eubacterium sp.]
MTGFNVISVTLYILGSLLSVPKGTDKIKYGWIVAFYIEIMLHAVTCTVLMGWNVGFHLYAIAVLPIAAYLLFLTTPIKRFIITMAIMIVANAVIMPAVMIYSDGHGSIEHVPADSERMIAFVNTGFTGIIILVFTFLFVLEISSMFDKLNDVNRQLEFIATHDALTGLYNRHSLKPLFEQLERGNTPYCIVMGDIDDFKKVNDTYGHDCGDIVLKSVSDIISDNIGEQDTACRWGGEEILIVMHGERDSCFDVISAIREKINALEIVAEDKSVGVSMTFGFVYCKESTAGIEALISVADSRLYQGKAGGKNVIIA